MKKLIHVTGAIRPGGGPAGYLYNLKEMLVEFDVKSIAVKAFVESNKRGGLSSRKFKLITYAPQYLRIYALKGLLFLRAMKYLFDAFRLLRAQKKNEYYVFHDQMMAYAYSKITDREFSVMPHQPVELSKEVSMEYSIRYGVDFEEVYDFYADKEIQVYKRSQYIIVPHLKSLDAYFLNTRYGFNFDEKKIISIVSTVIEPEVKKNKEALRVELGIPKNKKIIGFIGRYTKNKGFDVFNELVNKSTGSESIFFISAGMGDIRAPINLNYKDLGWYEDVGSLINLCDLIVVPNLHAYFDLLPIEALLLNTPVVITPAGGSAFLIECFEDKGVYGFFGDFDLSQTLKLMETLILDKKLVERVFSKEAFINSQLSLFDRVFNGGKKQGC